MRRSSATATGFFPGEFETLTAIVEALGLKGGGRFLARCYAGIRERVELTGGFEPLAGPVDWSTYVDGGLARLHAAGLARLHAAGLAEERVASLHRALEVYWMRALGQIAAEDVIHVGGGTEERRLDVFAYEPPFARPSRGWRPRHRLRSIPAGT
jgi:hypothetical protein